MKSTLRLATSSRGRCVVLAAWLTGQFAAPIAAAEPVPAPGFTRLNQPRPDARDADAVETPVRLNVFNAAWPDVLEKVAEQSGSTLVLHDPPPGRFTRADYRRYSREDAVAILNRELQPQGFRILENGPYLIVLSERTLRKQYRPSVIPTEDAQGRPLQRAEATEPVHRGYERKFDRIVPVAAEEDRVLEEPRSLSEPHPITGSDDAVTKLPVDAGPPVTLSVQVKRGTAANVATQVHDAFGTQSELANAGPSGLPSFRVKSRNRSAEGVRPVAFEVEINAAEDELLVTAPRRSASAIAELLRDVDRFAADPTQQVRVAPATVSELRVAEQLKPLLAQIQVAQAQPGQQQPAPAQPGLPQPGQPGQPFPQPAPQDVPREDGSEAVVSGALIGNLRGEVSIQAVPDLGLLILRGNDQDVQAIREVIQTLEDLSAGQQPVLELLRLEHVDSEALSTLMETVYGRFATIRNRGTTTTSRVGVIPVVKPNAVLIIAPEGEIESVLDLAAQLDQPVEPMTEFQVFRLRSALATQAANTITTFYTERAGLGTRATVIADVRTNSVIVAARPRDLEEIAALVKRIDRDESGLVNRLRVFPLRSASAEELAEVMNSAIQSVINPSSAQQQGALLGAGGAGGAGGAAAQELIAARSAVLEFLDASGDAPRLLRSGLLADIRVTPDPRTNSLLVTAGEQSLPLIEAMINQLDRPAAAEAVVKVFSLENTDAASVVELLDSLFGSTQAGQQQGQQQGAPGIQLAGVSDPGSSLIPLRFATDIRTNSVIATGSANSLAVVEAILFRLDESDVRERETTVIKLKNAFAPDVALALQNLLTSQRELLQISENLVSNVELLEREIIVVPEQATNSLIISATPRYFEQVRAIVARLDEAPPQVIIQAMLVEVTLDNADEFGIELGFQDSTLFDRSLTTANDVLQTIQETVTSPNGVQTTTQRIISQSATPGFNFNNTQQALGNNIAASPGSVGSQGLSNFSLGRANADLGFGGFVFSASSANVSVLLRALSAKRTIQVLSRPQIRTLDNQIAQVQVGQNVPVVDGVSTTGLQITPQIVRENAGLILTVVPRISPDGNVVMEVAAERSEFTGAGVPVFVDATTGTSIESPIKDITTARATVSVPTGQTIVLGGIITRSDDTLERKVPWVGDIPFLGQLFRYDSTRTLRRELLIFLTPRVIYNDADSELIKQIEADRLHFIEHEVESIHGPLYGVPPGGTFGSDASLPPVLLPGEMPPSGFPGTDNVPPGTEILPGLPAEACPPGVYPPGTLFEDKPADWGPPREADPLPAAPPYDAPQSSVVPSDFPPTGMPMERPPQAIQPTGASVATGRLAGQPPAKLTPPPRKTLLPSLRR